MTELHRHRLGPVDIVVADSLPDGVIDAPLGSELIHTNGSKYVNTDGAKAWGPDVMGKDYQTVAAAARSTTTSGTFQLKVQMTTPALTGVYRVGWMAVTDQSNNGDSVEARCYNVTDAALVAGLSRHEPQDADNRIHVGGFQQIVFTGAAKTFRIQWRQQDGSTAGIAEARIEIWRVA